MQLNKSIEDKRTVIKNDLNNFGLSTNKDLYDEIERNEKFLKNSTNQGFIENTTRIIDQYRNISNLIEKLKEEETVRETLLNKEIELPIDHNSIKKKLNSLNEKIENLEADIKIMPDCAEKKIMELILLVENNLFKSKEKINFRAIFDDAIKSIEHENQMNYEVKSKQIPDILQALMNYESTLNPHTMRDLIGSLNSLLIECLRPINLFELIRLVEKNKESAKMIEGQDITTFIGTTGSGKSTTILYLCGCKMIFHRIYIDDEPFDYIKNQDCNGLNCLQKVVSSDKPIDSETRYLTLIPLSKEHLQKILNSPYEYRSLSLVDAAGYGDSAGPEVDISNGIGTLYGIRKAKSVKLLILLSAKSLGNKGEGLLELLSYLIGLIPDINERTDSIMFLYTKFSHEELNNLPAILRSLINNYQYQIYAPLIQKMLVDTTKETSKIDPLDRNPKKVLNAILDLKSISSPSDAFKFSISSKSIEALQRQINKYEKNLEESLKRCDFNCAKFILDSFQTLSQIMSRDDFISKYQECAKNVAIILRRKMDENIEKFNKCLLLENSLTKIDLDFYVSCMANAENMNEIRIKHLEGLDIPLEKAVYEINLEMKIQDLIKDVALNSPTDPNNKILVLKLKSIQEYFPCYTKYLLEIINKIEEKSSILEEEAKLYLEKRDNTNLGNIMTILESLNTNFKEFTLVFHEIYNKILKCIEDELEDAIRNLKKILTKSDLEEKDINPLKNYYNTVKSIKDNPKMQPHINIIYISQIYEEMLASINFFFESITTDIEASQKISNNNDFKRMGELLNNKFEIMVSVNSLSEDVYFKTLESYNKTKHFLKEFVEKTSKRIESSFNRLKENDFLTIDFQQLAVSLNNASNLKWVEKHYKSAFGDLMQDINNSLTNYSEFISAQFLKFRFGIYYISEFCDYNNRYNDIVNLKPLGDFSKNIKLVIESTCSIVEKNIEITIENINSVVETKTGFSKINLVKIENSLILLDLISKTNFPIISKQLASKNLNNLKEYLSNYQSFSKIMIGDSLKKIKNFDKIESEDYYDESIEKLYFLYKNMKKIQDPTQRFNNISNIFINNDPDFIVNIFKELGVFIANLQQKIEIDLMNKGNLGFLLLEISKKFEHFDEFFNNEEIKKFNTKFFKKYLDSLPEQLKEAENAISAQNFDLVVSILIRFKEGNNMLNSPNYSNVIKKLKYHLDNLYKNSIQLLRTSFISEKNRKEIIINIEKVENNISSLSKAVKILNNSKNQIPEAKEFEVYEKHSKEIILMMVKNLNDLISKTNSYCSSELFKEFEDSKEFIGEILLKIHSDSITQHKEFNEISNQVNSFQSNLEKNMKNILKKYKEMDLKDFPIKNPKIILEKLEKLFTLNDNFYKNCFDELKTNIISKFRQATESLKLITNETNLKRESEKLKKLTNLVTDELNANLTQLIESTTYDFDNEIAEEELKLKRIIERKDANKIIEIYFSAGKKTNSLDGLLYKFFNEESNHYKEDSIRSFQNEDLDIALKNIEDVIEFIKKFREKNLFNEQSQQIFDQIIVNYYSKTEKNIDILQKIIYSGFSGQFISKDEATSKIKFLIDFVKNLNKRSEEVSKILCGSIQKISEFFSFLNLQLLTQEDEFNNSFIKNFNPKLILNVLNSANYLKDIMNLFKSNVSILKDSKDKNILEFSEKLIKSLSFQDFLEIIEKKMATTLDYLKTINIKKEFQFEKQIEAYFQDFHNKSKFHDECCNYFSEYIKAKNIDINVITKQKIQSLTEEVKSYINKQSLNEDDCKQINDNFNIIIKLNDQFKEANLELGKTILYLKKSLNKRITNIEKEALSIKNDVDKFTQILINLKMIAIFIDFLQVKINDIIDSILGIYKKEDGGENGLKLLIIKFEGDPFGKMIMSEHKVFKGINNSLFLELIFFNSLTEKFNYGQFF